MATKILTELVFRIERLLGVETAEKLSDLLEEAAEAERAPRRGQVRLEALARELRRLVEFRRTGRD